MLEPKWTIRWNDYSSNTYLYGSEITYIDRDNIHFENQLMPPGTIIKEWYSKVNFQAQRIEPSLPIIDGECRYRIKVNIDGDYLEGCIIRLVFFDKYEMEAGNIVVRGQEMEFTCPLKTYSYRMQLINGGMREFTFHSVEIEEIVG